MQNELLQNIENQINQKGAQLEAVRYSIYLLEKEHKNACDMVEHVPNNIYIEEWKASAKHSAKMLENMRSIYDQLAKEQEQLCNDYEKEEQRQQAIAKALEEQQANQEPTNEEPRGARVGYIVKDTVTNIETNKTTVYYMGVDGYINDEPKYCTPYRKRGAALNRIKKDVNFWAGSKYAEIISDSQYIEGKKWVHVLELVTIEF